MLLSDIFSDYKLNETPIIDNFVGFDNPNCYRISFPLKYILHSIFKVNLSIINGMTLNSIHNKLVNPNLL